MTGRKSYNGLLWGVKIWYWIILKDRVYSIRNNKKNPGS